ncbi:hypothetical protein WDU94_004316 [Cyamophila willieti]
MKAIPPGEDIKPDIKPSVTSPTVQEKPPVVVDNKFTLTAISTVEIKPSVETVPKSEPTLITVVAPVIKHELPTSTEVKLTPTPIKCSDIAPIERRRRRSIEEPKQKEVKEIVEDKTTECNKTTNHVNPVLTTLSPSACPNVTPSPNPTPKPKDCDVTEIVVDNKRDAERDRRKSKELIIEHSSSSSTVPTSIETTPTPTKSRVNEPSSDKVESKEKKEVKHNCVDSHSKHKERRESEKEKRKEKENVEIKSNSLRKEHENHKIQFSDRRTSKEDNEEKDKKKNNEHSISKQQKSRDTESEHSSSRHHNNIPRKEKHKSSSSSSSRHKENDKKYYDFDRKDNHDENKRKDNHEENKRKDNHEENRKKESPDEIKRKESNDEIKRKDSHDEIKRKDSNDEIKRKDSHDEIKRKDIIDEIKRKESHDEVKRKESHDEIKRKESHDEVKRKESHDEVKRKESHDEIKRKDSHDEIKRKKDVEDPKKKEVVDDHKRKDHEDKQNREDKESHSHYQRHNSHNRDKEHRELSDKVREESKHDHNGHKKKENSEETSRLKRKDSDHHHHDTSKRKDEEKKKEPSDKDRRKERYSFDSSETFVKKESEVGDKKKEFDMFKIERKRSYDNSDKTRKEDTPVTDKKENSSLIENISDTEESAEKRNHIKKDQRKERSSNNNSWPATVGCKRRLSSQDSLDTTLDDIKRMKPERRDSKDSKDSSKSNTSTSSSSSSQKKHGDKDKHQKNVAKMLEEKIKEDREKESLSKPKKENKESDDNDSPKARKEKKNNCEIKASDSDNAEKKKRNKVIRENGLTTCSESETGSCDDEGRNKKHSIFDIVDDTPAYISMYDKVKARSCKNMQKHEEEKKQEKMREKFSQLKQSRAKREEKKRSTSYDEDTDSERGIGRRNSKHMITSSEDDHNSDHYETKPKSKKTIISDTSDDDVLKVPKSKLKSKPRLLRSEDSELDTTQDSLLSFVKSEPKLEDTTATPVKEEMREHKLEEKNNKHDALNNKTNVDTDSETHAKKKSHRKKEKRQKSLDSSLSCNDTTNVSAKKEKHKKERRKSHNHDSDASGKHVKSRKKKNNRSSGNDKKLEVKLETSLFEPLSDDSGNPIIKDKINNTSSKWQVGQVFSDSDSDNEMARIQDKKRRERKSRELDEAGKALEAKLMDEIDHFDGTNVLVEKVKKKKKKKKKHHNHHKQRNIEHEEGDGDDEDEEARSAENEPPSTPPISNQCLSSLLESPPVSVAPSKKPEKPDIPGFGLPMDENVHDSAVKSISECENVKLPEPEPAPAPVEEKPTVVISQEETEDAVAALLGDAFGGDFDDYAIEDNNKPGSPDNTSEPDLRIDTDTEDTFDTLDFSKPPRTPDYPAHFETDVLKEKKVPGFVLPKTPDNKPMELPKTPGNDFKSEAISQEVRVNKTPEIKDEKMQLDLPLKMPPLRPFEPFKPEEKPTPVTTIDSRVYSSLEPINKTPKHINVPISSVLFNEKHKTTELLSHPSWTDKPMANLNKPITSLEHSIHKTVNHMDQYINKSPKANMDSMIKSKNQENIILKSNNNMLHSYERVPSTEQIFTNKPVVLSEQYKNIQNPDIVKNCIVSSELSHHKAIVSACKPPMSDVKSVITLNKSVAPPSLTDINKPQIHDNLQVKSSSIETSIVQSPQTTIMTTEQATKPKENFPVPKQNVLSHLIEAIDKSIMKEKVETPTLNSFHNKPDEHGGLKSNHACPVTIKQEDLIAKEKLERLYSNIQPDKYQFGNKTLTITDHNYVVNSYDPAANKPNLEVPFKPNIGDKSLPDVVQKPKLADKPLHETSFKPHVADKISQDVVEPYKPDKLPQEEINKPNIEEKVPEPSHIANVTDDILSEAASKPNFVDKPLPEPYKPNPVNKPLAEPFKLNAMDTSPSEGPLTPSIAQTALPENPSEIDKPLPDAASTPNLAEKPPAETPFKLHVTEKSPNETANKANPAIVEEPKLELKPEPKIVKFVEELNQKLNQEKSAQNLRKALVEESRKQHLEMLEKKEEPAVPIIAPLTPKMEEKPAIFVSPGESSCEPKDVESAQTRKDLTDEIKGEHHTSSVLILRFEIIIL